MIICTHQTAPTQYVDADGIRFAYRRFGNAAGVPLVFNQHFTGTMDHWDPAVTDGFAKDRSGFIAAMSCARCGRNLWPSWFAWRIGSVSPRRGLRNRLHQSIVAQIPWSIRPCPSCSLAFPMSNGNAIAHH